MKDENILPVVNPTFMKEPKIYPLESLYNSRIKLSEERIEERIEEIMWICLCCIFPAILLLIFILLITKII